MNILNMTKSFLLIIFTFFVYANLSYAEVVEQDDRVSIGLYSEMSNEEHSKLVLETGQVYKLSETPKNLEIREKFLNMKNEDKEQFYANRIKIMKPIVQGLEGKKKTQFIGKLIIFKNKILRINKQDNSSNIILGAEKMGRDKIQQLVDLLDSALWEGCLALAKVNEKGKSISITITLGAGFKKIGKLFGFSLGIGFYEDIQTGKRIVDFFYTKDSFDKAHTYALPSFVGVRVNWMNWRNSLGVANGEINGKGYSFPLWLPKLYVSPSEIQIASRFGIDILDLLIPFQTAAQFYEVNWVKKSFQPDINNKCEKFYTKLKGNNYETL